MVDGKRFFFCSFCILLQTSSILTFYIKSRAREDYLIGSDIYSDITDDLHHLVKRDSTGVKCYKSTFGTRVVQKTTVEACVVYCWYERCVAAMLKRGNLCKCLPEMSDGTKVDSGQCNIPCVGNKQQNCGGSNAYATYMTGYVHEPFVQRSSRYYPRNVLSDNIGCFIPPKRAAPTSLTIKSLRMTFMLCSYLCYQEKHNFAGLFKNDGCYCFFNGKGFQKTSQSKCSVPCAGHDSLKCGSTGVEMNVFRTNGNFDETAGTTTADYELPAWIAPPSQMINGGGQRSKAGGQRSKAGGRRSGASRRNGISGRRSGADRRGGAGGRQNPPKIRTSNRGGITSKHKNGIEKGPGKDVQRAKEGGKGELRIKGRGKGRRKGRGKGRRRRKGRGKGRRRGRGRGRRRRKGKRRKQMNTGNVNGNNRKGNGNTGYRTNVNRHKTSNRFGKTRNGNAQNYGDYGNNGDDYNGEDSGDDYNEENEGRSRNTKGRKSIKEKEKDEAEGGGWLGMLSRGATLNVCICKHILNMISCYIFIKYIVGL